MEGEEIQNTDPAPITDTPAPDPEPTPAPVQGELDFDAEKKKRTLSYSQQLTLLKGQIKAKGGKLTEAQVIAAGLKLHEARKQSAQISDENQDGRKRLSPNTENLLRWANNPGKFELIGVDTFERTDPTADYKRLIDKQKVFAAYGIKV